MKNTKKGICKKCSGKAIDSLAALNVSASDNGRDFVQTTDVRYLIGLKCEKCGHSWTEPKMPLFLEVEEWFKTPDTPDEIPEREYYLASLRDTIQKIQANRTPGKYRLEAPDSKGAIRGYCLVSVVNDAFAFIEAPPQSTDSEKLAFLRERRKPRVANWLIHIAKHFEGTADSEAYAKYQGYSSESHYADTSATGLFLLVEGIANYLDAFKEPTETN